MFLLYYYFFSFEFRDIESIDISKKIYKYINRIGVCLIMWYDIVILNDVICIYFLYCFIVIIIFCILLG